MNDLSVSVSVPNAPVPSMAGHAEAPAKVTARNLNFYYGEHPALKNINLTLGTHRVTAFIGPSGCGKSTLLRIFNSYNQGTVFLTHSAEGVAPEETGKMVFHRYGNSYFLSEVWGPASSARHQLSESRAEAELTRKHTAMETALLQTRR